MVHLLQFTCNMEKNPTQVSHVLLDSLFVVFQRLSNSDISPHDPYMHISKMSLIFSQQNIQPSFGTDHFCISKQQALLLDKDFTQKKLFSNFTTLLFLNLICSWASFVAEANLKALACLVILLLQNQKRHCGLIPFLSQQVNS